ncbi:MAG: hypothetical protein R3E96_11255 [Planctomycetota bacterium]
MGTNSKPIVINGPVVVRGDVLISGVVEGQGVIYSGGNTYVPDSIEYKHGPPQPRPQHNFQDQTEAWLTASKNTDFLGLFSAENIVVGDFTNPSWRSNVGAWMTSSMNQSAEDAGEDGIPNTAAGRDGILGTADDDVLEGDGVFTVEFYSAADAAAGMIPPVSRWAMSSPDRARTSTGTASTTGRLRSPAWTSRTTSKPTSGPATCRLAA